MSYSTPQTAGVAVESGVFYDGAGRLRAEKADHLGSAGRQVVTTRDANGIDPVLCDG